MNQLSIYKLQKLKNSLSHDRIHTYENLTDSNGAKVKLNYSFELYEWNAKVSALFLLPLHVCEVVIRNAVAESIERKYGTSWEKNNSFIITLTSSYQKELRNISKKYSTTGKVVAAMNFIFWQTMFTSRFDTDIWNSLIYQALPNLPVGTTSKNARSDVYKKLENLRKLRNRIAHHEPIFQKALQTYHDDIVCLIGYRCNETAQWISGLTNELVLLINSKPQP